MKKPGQMWKGPGNLRRGHMGQAFEEEEDEEDPEWVDFDPKKESGNFVGRAIPDEMEIKDNIKKEKERVLQTWGGTTNRR